ncbi:hypothetical protein HK101_011092, partial [Irineochytrium annulatum]
LSIDANSALSMTDRDISASFKRSWDPCSGTADWEAETMHLSTHDEKDGDFFAKFVNQSLVKRLETQWLAKSPSEPAGQGRRSRSLAGRNNSTTEVQEVQGADGGFRSVAAVFVSLLFPFELAKVQRVVVCYLAALRKFGGVFQQYSVDDKGQTLLAIFGLPPFTHVNNSDQCIKSMKLFVENLRVEFAEPVDLTISLATGDLLFTTIGTDFRSEAGEVIIIAARLLSIAKVKRLLVMDDITHEFVKLSNQTIDLGVVKAKGRANGVHAYGISFKVEDKTDEANEVSFGYEQERAIILQRFADWRESGRKAVVVIEAPSGLGKSCLANFLMDRAGKAGTPICLTQAEANVSLSMPLRKESLSSARTLPRRGHAEHDSHVASVLRKLLEKAGIDAGLMPLLAGVLPGLYTEENDRTRSLEGPTRNKLLTSVLAKVITAFVESTSVVFIFDDTQWLDSSTLEVLLHLSRFCPKVWRRTYGITSSMER